MHEHTDIAAGIIVACAGALLILYAVCEIRARERVERRHEDNARREMRNRLVSIENERLALKERPDFIAGYDAGLADGKEARYDR